ncbi:hypothetical protein [Chenggangzhangella methanolivorans]|uniref:Uncharacterized protein n=1 Tax=Chenggangzhangella methanolivorans TaxID=1437009 RepID=A0A9E6UIB0_9HYPH|nr:hypothetical protein [Chenggangzhangella methanolivorans]QZO00648.1 hypothetical protein K6K41_02730 [Chenggangzhangella methanolivorans]
MLTAVRYAVLFLKTPGKRREIAAERGVDPFSPSVEPALASWRGHLGKKLWLNLVGLPLGLFLLLLFVGEYM